MGRQIRFDALTVVTHEPSSAKMPRLEVGGLRKHVKRLIGAVGPTIEAGDFYDARWKEPNNVAHILMELLPLCLLARQAVGGDVTFLFRPLQPRFRDLLATFGINPLCTYRQVSGRNIEIYATRGLAQMPISEGAPGTTMYDLVGPIYDGMLGKLGKAQPKKLFISRRGERTISNETEVRKYLENIGYVTAYFEDLSIEDQISTCLSAEDIVCIHGAAMAYFVLKKQLGTVVELLPPNVYHDYFSGTIAPRSKRYVQLSPFFDESVQFAGWNEILSYKQRPFSVDMRQLASALAN